MLERLFVYGTLAPGRPNEHVLCDVAGTWQRGAIRGRLLNEGWAAQQGFPGVVIDPAGEPVDGYLFSSTELQSQWERLDDFEGSHYERVEVAVQLEDGQAVTAYVYQLRRTTPNG